MRQTEGRQEIDAVDVGDDYEPQCHEVGVARIAFYGPSHGKWLNTDHYHLEDPEPIAITDVIIDVMTEVYATVQMPGLIGLNQHGSLRCKVDISASGNVIPLFVFAKLFPKYITADGKPLIYTHQTTT